MRGLPTSVIINNVFLVYELLLVNVAIRASGEISSSTTRLNTLFPRSFQISAKKERRLLEGGRLIEGASY